MKLPKIKSCDRIEFVLSHCNRKNVLHLGCADWPFTEHKLKRGSLLHKKLLKVSRRLVGFDINKKGIRLMRESGISNLYLGNAELPLYEQLKEKFDVIVAGEVIEHVLNPGLFLSSLKSVCTSKSIIIITTTNFAPIKRVPRLLWRNEEVHPDHVAYYSVSTLTKLFDNSGISPIRYCVYWRDVGMVSTLVNRLFKKISIINYFADGICVACKIKDS